ncbi:MAG TPA: hypothetical protein VLF94_04395, partial [Chlamydiales bacterium]|nr:hypothetical protein [Chlamydiales bacterium]
MAISSFFDLFFSTPSAEQKALIQKYPYIDVRVLGKPERVELEAELYRDMGERAYRSLLSRMGTTTVVNFAASDLLFKKMTGETGPEVSKLPLRQRCLQLCQMDRRNAFWARLPQREDLRMVVERAFPSFAEGRELATPADWVRIQEVLREFERRMDNRNAFWARLPQREDLRMVVERAFPTLAEGRELATPAEWDHIREVLREFELCQGRSGNALDRIAFDAYLDRLRLRDFYEREIKCARQLNCPEAVAAFEREIQQGDKPVYPLPERLRLWMGHSEAKGLVDKLAQDILEGHSLKLNWNNHLARSAHIAEIRAKGGRGEDLDRFDKIAVELEKLFENRELLDFLEEQYKGFDSGAEKRKYDLAKAAKQIAEIPLSFFNWM